MPKITIFLDDRPAVIEDDYLLWAVGEVPQLTIPLLAPFIEQPEETE